MFQARYSGIPCFLGFYILLPAVTWNTFGSWATVEHGGSRSGFDGLGVQNRVIPGPLARASAETQQLLSFPLSFPIRIV